MIFSNLFQTIEQTKKETVLTLEYVEALSEPKLESDIPHPDWVTNHAKNHSPFKRNPPFDTDLKKKIKYQKR